MNRAISKIGESLEAKSEVMEVVEEVVEEVEVKVVEEVMEEDVEERGKGVDGVAGRGRRRIGGESL